jgi:hypothetical protein
MKKLTELNQYRDCAWELRAVGVIGDDHGGMFRVPFGVTELRIMASSGGGWDHISVSTEHRSPTWDELEHVRKLFAKPDETWMQLHVPQKEHVNYHPYCLHLWRPLHRTIPTPPSIMVGPK